MSTLYYRSIFISDVHLGTKSCKAAYLLNFLRSTESDTLYLVGDIIDLIAMKKHVFWDSYHADVVKEIFRISESGTEVIYIPGNHDHWARRFCGSTIHGIKVRRFMIHHTPSNKQYFVSHGDEFDVVVKHNKLMYFIGDKAYGLLLRMNLFNNFIRRHLNLPYWSLSTYIKSHIKKASEYINNYKQAAITRAKSDGHEGYICGHIHKSGISKVDDILYCNTGDWVEHCTALVEDFNGHMKILHWSDHAKVEVTSTDEAIIEADIPLLVANLK